MYIQFISILMIVNYQQHDFGCAAIVAKTCVDDQRKDLKNLCR